MTAAAVRPPAVFGLLALASLTSLMLTTGAACAADTRVGGIYTCIDANGKKLTADRPIAECNARDQRLLNADGSVKRVLPPTLTAEELAEQEARERRLSAERAAQQDALRRDRNLRLRFPTEAAHSKARAAALDDVRKAIAASDARIAALAVERKPLQDEAEFYKGKPLPRLLKQQLDGNEAIANAQRTLIQNQQTEAVRINTLFDAELARLRQLWSGTPEGSPGGPPPRK